MITMISEFGNLQLAAAIVVAIANREGIDNYNYADFDRLDFAKDEDEEQTCQFDLCDMFQSTSNVEGGGHGDTNLLGINIMGQSNGTNMIIDIADKVDAISDITGVHI